VRPWPDAANCSIDEFASAQIESAWAMNCALSVDAAVWVVSVGRAIGVSGELSPPHAERTIPAETAAAGTRRCRTRHIRPRKVARMPGGAVGR
jgi:hypothetical protein